MLAHSNTCRKLSQESEISAVQGQVVNFLRAHDLSHRRVLRLEQRNLRSHFHGLCHLPRLKREVHDHLLLHVNRDVRVARFLESLELGVDRVGCDFHRCKGIATIRAGRGGYGEAGTFVGQRHFGARHHGAGRVLDRPQDRSGVDLGKGWPRQQQEHYRQCERLRKSHKPACLLHDKPPPGSPGSDSFQRGTGVELPGDI